MASTLAHTLNGRGHGSWSVPLTGRDKASRANSQSNIALVSRAPRRGRGMRILSSSRSTQTVLALVRRPCMEMQAMYGRVMQRSRRETAATGLCHPIHCGPLYRGERGEAQWHPRSPIRSTAEDTAAAASHSRAGASIAVDSTEHLVAQSISCPSVPGCLLLLTFSNSSSQYQHSGRWQ